MRILFVYFIVIVTSTSLCQDKLARKYRGIYQGEISAYQVFTNNTSLEISKTSIDIALGKSKITMKIGKLNYEGNFSITPKKNEIIFIANMEGLSIPEKITLNKKTKELTRFGRSPQPNAKLLKVKKSKK